MLRTDSPVRERDIKVYLCGGSDVESRRPLERDIGHHSDDGVFFDVEWSRIEVNRGAA
jgi:hypothetical protein